MRLVIQRVTKAEVSVEDKIVGKIDKGLLVLVGFKKGDTEKAAQALSEKLAKLRVMADDKDKMNLSILDTNASVLVVSQFTLYANTKDGNRPSFIEAEDPPRAEALYNYFINCLKDKNIKVETGSFGQYMKIDTELDGPVTIILES